jgi:hypothetical protein
MRRERRIRFTRCTWARVRPEQHRAGNPNGHWYRSLQAERGNDPVGHYWLEAPRRARGRSLCERDASPVARAVLTQTRSDRPAIASGFTSMRLRLRSMTGANQREAAAACAGRAAREAAARPPPAEAAPLRPSGFAVARSRRDEVGKGAVAHPAAPSKPGSTALWPMMLNSSCSGAV